MRTDRIIHIVSAHAEGEVGDVVVGGVAPPPGATLWERRDWLERDGALWRFLLNEPRGGVFRHVNLLTPPVDPRADAAFLVMEPAHVPPFSGSNSLCVATVLLETGIMPKTEPETRLVLEAPIGLVEVRAGVRDGAVDWVEIQGAPSFVDRLDAPLEIEGLGTLMVDVAFGGDSFVILPSEALGFALTQDEARDIAAIGARATAAANEQLGFRHPTEDWTRISFCQVAGPLGRTPEGALTGSSAVVIDPGKLDRSPCGTGCSARMATLAARGALAVGESYVGRSMLGTRFDCRVVEALQVGDRDAIRPTIRGRAWITGTHQVMRDPRDPFPEGYRLSDTWPTSRPPPA